ncbi:hypothetical protein ACROYT_G011161 [Oculina patagonica]
MSTTLSWIIFACLLCSILPWGSAFTAASGKGGTGRLGKRRIETEAKRSNEQDLVTAFCQKVRPCEEDYRRETFQRAARPVNEEEFRFNRK